MVNPKVEVDSLCCRLKYEFSGQMLDNDIEEEQVKVESDYREQKEKRGNKGEKVGIELKEVESKVGKEELGQP